MRKSKNWFDVHSGSAKRLSVGSGAATGGAGVWAGRYDATGEPNRALSLNTSAVVLEALAYHEKGPFFRRGGARARVAKVVR